MQDEASVTFGPFRLDTPIGEGGMGVVYRGEHRRDGRRVAVKVMTSDLARKGEHRSDFRREVQALAKLNHPAVARVVDYGVVDEEIAAAAPERIVEGAPWFAMEFVEGKEISEVLADWEWERVEQFLLVLLDALAHAHANEVVHRDLKPSNILITDDAPGELELKLVDFGIAHVFDTGEGGGIERAPDTWGTPEVMAPEQIRGDWREQGPWTDLYAVGCVAWWMLTRRIPFDGEDRSETYLKHMSGTTGPYQPVFEVPSGLERWLERMLAVDRRERFQRAADAAYALVRISQLPADPSIVDPAYRETGEFSPDSIEALGAAPSTRDEESDRTIFEGGDPTDGRASGSPSGPEGLLDVAPPPIPDDWERAEPPIEQPAPDAGRSLFDLRKIPLVDRRPERDQLWRALRAVQRTQQPVARLLRGPAGSGKSRLADWVARRGHELGAVTVMKATHTPKGGPRDGIGPMLLRQFRCEELDWSDGLERVRNVCESLGIEPSTAYHDAVGLARMMGLDEEEKSAPPGFRNPREKHLALRRLFASAAARRPVLLWLDDVAWGWESARFAEFLLEESFREPLPVFIVMTARDNAIEERPQVRRMLDTICEHEFGSDIRVRPLDRESHLELVEQLLHLDEQLVDDIVSRTEGHPLFAIQLVGDWVERGVLAVGPDGFELRDREDRPIPDGPHDLWRRRIDQVLETLDEAEREAGRKSMELGAALGRHVDRGEWRAVCRRANVTPRDRLVGTLVEYGLARREPSGWSFIHTMLAESLERQARDRGRWSRWHEICAEAIRARYPERLGETAERRAEHYIEAGMFEKAAEPLLRAARRARRLGDHREHRQFLDRRREILDRIGADSGDRRVVSNEFERARLARNTGEHDEARRQLERVEEAAREHDWPRVLGGTLRFKSQLARDEGSIQRCLELAEAAEETFRDSKYTLDRARCHMTRAQALVFLGEFGEARAAFRLAKSLFEAHDRPEDVLRTETWITYTHIYEGNYETSRERAREILERARELGDKSTEADAWNQLGECARFEREWGEARRYYERSAQEYQQIGYRGVSIAKMNMAMVEIPAGRYERARRELSDVAERLEEVGLRSRLPHAYTGLLGAAAGLGDWTRFDELLERVADRCNETEGVSKDTAWLAEHAARVTAERGAEDRARRLYEIARTLWNRLGSEERVARIEGLLE